nr:hypothetical protein [Citrobacter freundii]
MLRTLNPTILHTGAVFLALILIYTGISASEKITWLMEVTPVIIVVPLLLATMRTSIRSIFCIPHRPPFAP